MPQFSLVTVEKSDLLLIHQLNESCLPHVNSIPLDDFRWYLDVLHHFYKVVDADGVLAGTVVVMNPTINYDSVNYRWFVERYTQFLYIDRIMVSAAYRGQGVASFIYKNLTAIARDAGCLSLCCEVNLQPENVESLALHEKMGFSSVGTQSTENGTKQVTLLMKPLG
jgi:predicted GNAT superfamily acetyltransferase